MQKTNEVWRYAKMKRSLLKTLALACVTSVMLMGCGKTGNVAENVAKEDLLKILYNRIAYVVDESLMPEYD